MASIGEVVQLRTFPVQAVGAFRIANRAARQSDVGGYNFTQQVRRHCRVGAFSYGGIPHAEFIPVMNDCAIKEGG